MPLVSSRVNCERKKEEIFLVAIGNDVRSLNLVVMGVAGVGVVGMDFN
jgi:hypothetical protein